MSFQIGAFFPTRDMPPSGQGIGAVAQQIEALQQFCHAMR
jgi:hypothetical protein